MRSRLLRPTLASAASLALTAALCSLSASAAHAGITQYNDQLSFTSATTGVTTITFEGLAPTGGIKNYGNPGSLNVSGVNFTSQGNLFVIDPGFSPSYDYGTGANVNVQSGAPNILTAATLPGGVTAVGMNLAGAAGTSADFTITLTNGSSTIFTLTTPDTSASAPHTWSFIGFTTDTGNIASISFSSFSYVAFDNFQYGTAAIQPVPEPSEYATAFALFGTTALGMVTARIKARRRKTVSTATTATA